MGDAAHPPPPTAFLSTGDANTSDHFVVATPSGLTPNTRTEAEAALSANTSAQTDSAAPTTPLPASATRGYGYPGLNHGIAIRTSSPGLGAQEDSLEDGPDDTVEDAKSAYRRPPMASRTSTSNYAEALAAAGSPTSPTSFSPISKSNIAPFSPISPNASSPSIDLSGGVVPLKTGVGAGQAEAVKRVRPTGLSLGALGRQQSWSKQDMKHIYSQRLMAGGDVGSDQGYSTAGRENEPKS